MTEKNEEASAMDAYTVQLEERMSKFEAAILSLERAIQVLADSKEAKSRHKEDQEQQLEFSKKKKLEQKKQLQEMRMEIRKHFKEIDGKKKEDSKSKLTKLVQP